MSASNKPLNPREVIPEELLPILPRPVGGVVGSYIDTADLMEVEEKSDSPDKKPVITKKPIWLGQSLSFWGNSLLQKQILTLVEYAAPLDEIEKYIRQAHAKNEPFLQDTLIRAIQCAVIGLDQTIRDENGQELRDKEGKLLNEGMAERLLKLHAELFPENHENALAEARLAPPEESKEAKQKREDANTDAMGNLFTAFIQNDEKALSEAIETFKTFVKNLKPATITNNQYYLNLLHLISVAFNVLATRGG
ncbi:MAG TPA: hypothetical protein VHA13_03120, partial [Gammaproteobacteria bacterium]|nr:hypothetical protein [Gammaproteobacteria bacterium]